MLNFSYFQHAGSRERQKTWRIREIEQNKHLTAVYWTVEAAVMSDVAHPSAQQGAMSASFLIIPWAWFLMVFF